MPRLGPPHANPYPPPAEPVGAHRDPRPAQRGIGRTGLAAIVVLASALGGALALGGAAISGNLGGTTTVVTQQGAQAVPLVAPAPAAATLEGGERADGSVQAVVARSSPAVVKITVGADDNPAAGRLGSGFLIDRDGLVLTNAHVVGDAQSVDATFEDGTEADARVLGRDESSDLAVLRVDEVPSAVEPLALGSSLPLVVGDPVIAIGNPFGLERTATIGIVSALKRIIRAPNDFEIQNVIQTDAAINQGNSGGPLLDGAGRVVGINTQIATGSGGNDGIGFAVPIDSVRPVVNAIVATGSPAHAWLGVTGRTITPAIARALGYPDVRGVAVLSVDDRGPAAGAGLRPASTPAEAEVPRGGDLIVSVNGMPITDMADVSRAVSSRAVGDRIELTVLRDDRRVELTIELAQRPADVGLAPRSRP